MPAEPTITVRRPEMSIPSQIDPLIIEGQPELSYALVGLALIAPHVEPYLIRTMNQAKRRVTDPELLEAIGLFNGQEGQHARLHMRFNKAVRTDCPALVALEEELARDFRRFTTTRSLEWNLAYAEGFEAFTAALANYMFEAQTLLHANPVVRDLFEWHIVEELEHRCVAFDVYEHVGGGYAYRTAVRLYAQQHLARFTRRAMRALAARDRAAGRDHGGKAAAGARVVPLLVSVGRKLLPKVLASYAPGYTPHRLAMPAQAERVLERLAGRTFDDEPEAPAVPAAPGAHERAAAAPTAA